MNAIFNNIIYKNDRSALYILAANNFSQFFDADVIFPLSTDIDDIIVHLGTL